MIQTQAQIQAQTQTQAVERPTAFWAAQAWIEGRWQQNALLQVGKDGHWLAVKAGVPQATAQTQFGATVCAGPVLPSLVNAHSHAFQRAFAGMAETRHSGADHFWSWRDRMYAVANRVTPSQLRAIAAQLYLEMLQGGYTQVCEFHYLHRSPSGAPYSDPHAMSAALIEAAQSVGIGLTLLPVLYERAGFAAPQLRPDQLRFESNPQFASQLCQTVNLAKTPLINAGVAVHSLRAASPASIHALRGLLAHENVPIHIHVAEQTAEVTDCLGHTDQRPVQWLAAQGLLDARWQLVHATHTTAAEIDAVAASGAGVVICPSTEGNLGDGFTDAAHWLNAGVGFTVGSDSHVSRNWREELRWLEYGQRLNLRQRNVCAAPQAGFADTAHRLFDAAVRGSAAAAGLPLHGIVAGARADFLVLDAQCPALLGMPPAHTLNALVFAADTPAIAQVYVAGAPVIHAGHGLTQHAAQVQIKGAFVLAMEQLHHG